jgi:magnesium-transporting ATPase (P-type)
VEGKTVSQETKTKTTPQASGPTWHGSDAAAVAQELNVEPEHGLSAEEAGRRLRTQGPNRLAGTKK